MASLKYKRKIVEELVKYLHTREAIIIYGARQVGKTTLMKYLMENHIKDNMFYLDMEFPNLLELCNEGPENVHNYLLQKGADEKKKIFLLIDEIQYLEDPAKFIKIFHDHYPNIKLLVSGSSTFEIKKKLKQSLAGRTLIFELYPLSFDEFLIFKDKNYKLNKDNSKIINDELVVLAEEYIKYGGYPKIVLEKTEERKFAYLSQIISTYIRKDIRDIGNIRNISVFNKLVEIMASQSGQLLNVSELASTLGMNRETIMEYLDLLEQTFIIKRIKPFHKNIRSELSKNPKVFFLDIGMLHLLWLKEFPKVILGNVFETFVFLELMKLKKEIYFWRTTNKQEVDFILIDKEIYAIEAKHKFSSSANLSFFSKTYKCKSFVAGLKGVKQEIKSQQQKYVWELVREIG